MRTKFLFTALLLFTLEPQLSTFAQGAAFTYQGRLNDGVNPANGVYDFQFALYDADTNGNQIGGLITNSATGASNGLFTVTLDFGPGIFTGAPRWVEISARTNGPSSFTTLAPRQAVTPAPYAAFAAEAALAAGLRGLMIQQNTNGAPNIIGGSPVNFVGANLLGATVSGGGATNSLGVAFTNSVLANFGTVSGGAQNIVGSRFGTVGGGAFNVAGNFYATVSGGWQNTADGFASAIAGGYRNRAAGLYSFAGGYQAQALHDSCFVWADDFSSPFSSTGPYQFLIRATGGVGIGTNAPSAQLHVATTGIPTAIID